MPALNAAVPNTTSRNASTRIRALSDTLRLTGMGGQMVVTRGVSSLPTDDLMAALQAVAAFDGFTADNDPYGEQDGAMVEMAGHRIFWKIDYYDLAMQAHSPDPADPACTCRVMTIMLAEEY